jgi:hypothetical protein
MRHNTLRAPIAARQTALSWPALAAALLLASPGPVLAQSESYMLKPGSKVGPATQVKETDCVTNRDGSRTCNTKLVNPAGDTQAKPIFTPFKN